MPPRNQQEVQRFPLGLFLLLLNRSLIPIFFTVWLWSAFWNFLQTFDPTIPFMLGTAAHAWRYQLLSGNIFFILHSLDTKGPRRTLLFVFWSFFWAFVFEHFGISCYESIGCPFGRYTFTAPILNAPEGIKVGVVPFSVMLSWFTWTYLIYHTSNLIAYGATNTCPTRAARGQRFFSEVIRMSIIDSILNALRASVTDAIYTFGVGVAPKMIIWDLKDHTLFLDIPLRNSLMWLPAAFLISFLIRSYEYLMDREGYLIHPDMRKSMWNSIIDYLFVLVIIGGFPVIFMLSPDLPVEYRVASAVNMGIPMLIGVFHWVIVNKLKVEERKKRN